jgi:hypothetical protein
LFEKRLKVNGRLSNTVVTVVLKIGRLITIINGSGRRALPIKAMFNCVERRVESRRGLAREVCRIKRRVAKLGGGAMFTMRGETRRGAVFVLGAPFTGRDSELLERLQVRLVPGSRAGIL